jgi:ribosome-associated protein
LIDLGDVVAHVFHRDERSYYKLERLWGDAPLEDIHSALNT